MKLNIKSALVLIPATLVLAFTSCKKNPEVSYYSEATYSDIKETEYTKWMPRDDLQMVIDNLDIKRQWIYRVEGRDYKGLSQYRYALRNRPDDATHLQVRSGRNDGEYFNLGVGYHRDGYKRVSLQLFKDASGIMRYNGVWFKYGEKEEPPRSNVLPPTDTPPSKLDNKTSEKE